MLATNQHRGLHEGGYMTEDVYEYCPHCENEAVVKWDIEADGMQIYCPYCGKPIMLCSECEARDGAICDWEEKKGCHYSDDRYRAAL